MFKLMFYITTYYKLFYSLCIMGYGVIYVVKKMKNENKVDFIIMYQNLSQIRVVCKTKMTVYKQTILWKLCIVITGEHGAAGAVFRPFWPGPAPLLVEENAPANHTKKAEFVRCGECGFGGAGFSQFLSVSVVLSNFSQLP